MRPSLSSLLDAHVPLETLVPTSMLFEKNVKFFNLINFISVLASISSEFKKSNQASWLGTA